MEKKLAIVCSHPIQYYAPMFRYWAQYIDLEVIYCHKPTAEEIGKQGFGIAFEWDVDLMAGYRSHFIPNVSKHPSMDSFGGCDSPSIGKKIKELRATHVLVLGWYLKSYIQAYLFCLLHKIPVAVRGDSQLNPMDAGWKHTLKKWLYPLFLQRFRRILYVGKRNKEYLFHYGAKESQLLFSPHAVDQTFWTNSESKRNSEKTIFLWVGKFTDKKRPSEVIEAMKLLTNPTIELWMVGTGHLLEISKEHAINDPRIKFLGFKNQTELKSIYAESNCLVLTSDHRETWGLVVNEAMSMGMMAIVSDACGCSADMVLEGENGYIYQENDIRALAQSMDKVVSELGKESNARIQALKKINDTYSYHSNLQAIQSFLES